VAQANHDRDRALDDNTFNGMPDVGMEVKEEELEDILPRLDNSSSSGPCGMTNCLLKSLAHVQDTGGYSSAWFRRALCFQLTRIVQCTNICESERRILAMSKVCFIPKGEQGKFRPLGITATIARLASKILLKRSAAYVATILPHQLAIGIPDGATLGAELMQTLLEKDYMVALFDASNALNLISRDLIYQQLQANFPSLLPIFSLYYGIPSRAVLSKGILAGTIYTGVKQGCCLAMLCFCIAINPLLK